MTPKTLEESATRSLHTGCLSRLNFLGKTFGLSHPSGTTLPGHASLVMEGCEASGTKRRLWKPESGQAARVNALLWITYVNPDSI